MKNTLIFGSLFLSVFAFSQCSINGKSSIRVLDEEVYSIAGDLAQCKDCHLWVNIGGNAYTVGDNRQNTVKIKATSGGREVISLAVLSPQGLVQCSKNIDILDSAQTSAAAPETSEMAPAANIAVKCDIEVKGYKEVKYAEGTVSFFPDITKNDYKYEWNTSYATGETMQSTEKVPQFPYTKEKSITKVRLKIVSQKCVREYTKTYDASYWKFF
ncbi:MAG: hypothetical protein K0M63_08535 [Weeksellaceae bacterium]|nr:hypothetical protein [Weeksellaceae bacterium]